jgi:class 3 adenylate cyclase
MNQHEILQRYPWDPARLGGKKPVEYFFSVELAASPYELWPHISNTTEINERLGLSAMTFTERNGITIGSNTLAGTAQEWEEVPWKWEYGRFIISERIYSRGLTSYVRGIFDMEDLEDGSTRFTGYFGFVPKGAKGRTILSLAKPIFTKNYISVLKNIESEIIAKRNPSGVASYEIRPLESVFTEREKSPRTSPMDTAKIREIYRELKTVAELDETVVKSLIQYVLTTKTANLYRMRPKELAETMSVDENTLLLTMLHATRTGLLNLTWDVICPHCQGIRERADHLWEVNKQARCEVCRIDFDASAVNAIEISFHINPYIGELKRVLYCSAEPAKKPHIRYQNELLPGEEVSFLVPFSPGRYRMRKLGQTTFILLDIRQDQPVKQLPWSGQTPASSLDAGPGSIINIHNDSDLPETYVVEEYAEDRYALRPKDLFSMQEFRDLFSRESLSTDLSIDVGVQNIVFVDIIGSTEMYQREGNSKAFSYVREYFKLSHEIARRYRGAIVKTMGDAIFLAFSSPMDAFRASVAFSTVFDGKNEKTPIRLRISLNRGSCLAVNLSNGIDYFGQTVNIVAKLQKFATADEIVLSRDFLENELVKAYLKKQNIAVPEVKAGEVAGIGDVEYALIKARYARTPVYS